MSTRRDQFNWPHQIKARPIPARFGLRREPETKKQVTNDRIFTYDSPGRGVSGESSN